MKLFQTAERHSAQLPSDNVMHQRHMIAYNEASKQIHGRVLEIGSGEGYGIEHLYPQVDEYHAVDKFLSQFKLSEEKKESVFFYQMEVPPLQNIPENYFDFVVSFQVIEHIQNDEFFLREIYRVLKPNGKLILTTPNRLMSLTRNPWHIREYTTHELKQLSSKIFDNVSMFGIYGKENVMDYYQANKKSVERITRFDIFNFQYRLPRKMLQVPYDILNRINRMQLHKKNTNIVHQIQLNDFYLSSETNNCFDFFVVAEKNK